MALNRRSFLSLFSGGPIFLPLIGINSPPPTPQKRYESTMRIVDPGLRGEPMATMNELGQEGWFHTGTVEFKGRYLFLFSREILG